MLTTKQSLLPAVCVEASHCFVHVRVSAGVIEPGVVRVSVVEPRVVSVTVNVV